MLNSVAKNVFLHGLLLVLQRSFKTFKVQFSETDYSVHKISNVALFDNCISGKLIAIHKQEGYLYTKWD